MPQNSIGSLFPTILATLHSCTHVGWEKADALMLGSSFARTMERTLDYGGAQTPGRSCRSALIVGLLLVACPAGLSAGTLDLSHAVVVTSSDPGKLETQAARMLIEEVGKRSGMHWSQ